jgi:hypothetical protein
VFVKNSIYAQQPTDIDDLKAVTAAALQQIAKMLNDL